MSASRTATPSRTEAPAVQDFFVPPAFFDEADEDLPKSCTVTFSGQALAELAHGARLLGVPLGDFVRLAVRQRAYLAEMQMRGSRIVLRDQFGSDFELPVALSL